MALLVEWLAHAALHSQPGLLFHGFNQLRIFKGLVIQPEEPPFVRMLAGPAMHTDGFTLLPVELRGSDRQGRDLLHAHAGGVGVVFAHRLPKKSWVGITRPFPHSQEELYSSLLFHGPDLYGIEQIDGVARPRGSPVGSKAARRRTGSSSRCGKTGRPIRWSWIVVFNSWCCGASPRTAFLRCRVSPGNIASIAGRSRAAMFGSLLARDEKPAATCTGRHRLRGRHWGPDRWPARLRMRGKRRADGGDRRNRLPQGALPSA